MALSLSKGQNLSLSKTDPSLKNLIIGLGWDPRATDGQEFDLDASAFMLTATGKVRAVEDFIFYGKLKSDCGSIEHTGDNRTGAGDGDDEQIKIHLDKVPADIQRIAVTVTIYKAKSRSQNFGQVSNAFVRVVNETTGAEVVRYDLTEDASIETAMVFADVYRHNGEWKFKAVGQGFAGGLKAMCDNFGIPGVTAEE
jgi:tellurium resistance protein TerD